MLSAFIGVCSPLVLPKIPFKTRFLPWIEQKRGFIRTPFISRFLGVWRPKSLDIAHFFEVLHCPLSSPISSKVPKPDYDSKSVWGKPHEGSNPSRCASKGSHLSMTNESLCISFPHIKCSFTSVLKRLLPEQRTKMRLFSKFSTPVLDFLPNKL